MITNKNSLNSIIMKKSLLMKTMLLLWALIVGSSSVWADEETITLSEQGYDNAEQISSTSGTNIALSYTDGNTPTAYYNTGNGVRVYYGGKISITAGGKTITKVSITHTKEKSPTVSWSSDGSTTKSSTGTPATWEGSATEVDFNIATKGHVRVQSVTVTYEGGGGSTTYTVTYDANGATSGSTPIDGTAYDADNNTVTVLGNTGDLAKEHYTFAGWNTKTDGTGTGYVADDTFEISANTTLYAQWTVNTNTVTLPEADQYGEYTMSATNPVAYGTEVTLTYTPATGYENYKETWSVNGEEIQANQFIMPDEAVTVTVSVKESTTSDIVVDFEDNTSTYTDWTFTNINGKATDSGVNPHGGSYFGVTAGTQTASIVTKEKVNPVSLICYVSKKSTNTTSSTWYVQVSEDGNTWTDAGSCNGASMSKGEWNKLSADLSDYSDVYVRVYYSGSTAVRCIDDLTLTVNGSSQPSQPQPSFTASDVNIAYNATSGSVDFELANGVKGGIVTATTEAEWLTLGTVDGTSVPFTTTVNEKATERTAVVTLTYTYNENETVTKDVNITQAGNPNVISTIAEVRVQGTGSVTTKGVVTSCIGTTAYIQDENAAICVYGEALTVGDEVKVSGTLSTYKGLLEITSPEVTVLSQGNTVTPTVMRIAEINASDNQGWLVKIEDATVTAISGQNTTIAQGENTIVVYGITGVEYDQGDVLTLIGNIGCYNNAQIANPTDVAVAVKPATPTFSVAEGTYSEAQSVELSTATEGATIYYTIDTTEPTAESTEYTSAIEITVTTTIKAIAVKDDVASDVATATYTINLTPTITVAETALDAPTEGKDGTITVTYNNITNVASEVYFCDADGNAANYDWVEAEINDENNIEYIIDANESTEARTAYMKVYALDDNAENVYSELITITQAGVADKYALFSGDLVEGDYIIYYDGHAMNTTVDGSGRLQYAEVTPENDVISTNNAAIVWHIAKSGDYWTIYNAEADAYAASTGAKNKAQMLVNGTDDMALWTVSRYDDAYEFVNKKNSAANVNAYLRNNGSYGFACYAEGTGGDLLLYKRVPATITLAEACNNGKGKYYGTYSNASAFVVPSDLTVAEIGLDAENKLIVTEYATGDIVPANTGVMVSSTEYGDYSVELTHNAGTSVMGSDNCLRATGNEGITAATMDVNDVDCVFYRLTMHNKTDLGFYYGAANGAAFAVAANKAYLAVPKTAGARIQGFSLDGDTVTGISQIENGKSEVENYFDLQGRIIANPAKGLYIKNGKKVVIR